MELILVVPDESLYRGFDKVGPNVRLVKERGFCFAHWANTGIRQRRYDPRQLTDVVLLHDDIVLLPQEKDDWINRLLTTLHSDKKVGATGPLRRTHGPTGIVYVESFCMAISGSFLEGSSILPDEDLPSGQTDDGPFDSALSPYGEDVDLCERMRRFGFSINPVGTSSVGKNGQWVGDFPIWHGGGTTIKIAQRTFQEHDDLLVKRYSRPTPKIEVFPGTAIADQQLVKEPPKIEVVEDKLKVTVEISTKDRYETTLPIAVASVINQTLRPHSVIIYDDGDGHDITKMPQFAALFRTMERMGIMWYMLWGKKSGQVHNHQHAALNAPGNWIWRVDDDNMAEHDTLEKLAKVINPDVGAVAGRVQIPDMVQPLSNIGSGKIADVYHKLSIQLFDGWSGVREVDHLHNTFLFRKAAATHGYPMNLSPVGHREETIFTYGMRRVGWKLLVNPDAVTWHLRSPLGGIRSYTDHGLWHHDDAIFSELMKDWGIVPTRYKLIVLDCGLGDHWVFKMVLPEIRARWADHTLQLATCYPGVFEDDNVEQISIADAKFLEGDLDRFNIYGFCTKNNWSGTLAEAFLKLYERS